MRHRILLASLMTAALAGPGATQSFNTITFESFDYPAGSDIHGQAGGTGWANAWWAGASPGSNGLIVSPSLDATGGACEMVVDDQGAYRFPATAGFEQLLDYSSDPNGLFGKDDTTIWLSFWTQRRSGGDARFGGISLNHQFVAEHLFLGAPNTWDLWGYHDDPWNVSGIGNIVNTVASSNIDQLTHLVYRLDFLPGQERLRLWIDPVVDHPDTPADIDDLIHDFRFNELGLKSGHAVAAMGWWFDGLLLETTNSGTGTAFCAGDLACPCGNPGANGSGCANGTGLGALLTATGSESAGTDSLKFYVEGAVPNQPGLFFQGDNAVGGGSGAPFGDGLRCAGGGVVRIQVAVADSAGAAQSSTSIVGATGVIGGETRRYQFWYRDPAGSPCGTGFNLSNGLELTWMP